ncbi:hypothetical protein [Flagellimonas myxillae]|uniref:hypothetical protein n=1 Tax=Flagellimonas myxillae TaxID=2942214 RepID=UPI00201FAFF4|nr:hypothetical protein [Muricauda myxillae]MCL6265476.1 hypothetical protein [Muricauda myxillae]
MGRITSVEQMEMIKKNFGFWVASFAFLLSLNLMGQVGSTNTPRSAYQEIVYLHHNKALVFAGEQLYYKMYVLQSGTKAMSNFSKIGYVELVGEDSNVVFRHKIRLNNGIGQGEFFIPVTVPSGNYKLIGYTQWMKNSDMDHFFKSDIGLINPFQNNQTSIAQNLDESNSPSPDTDPGNYETENTQNRIFTFALNKKTFTFRDQGILTIKALQKNSGSYSLSISKLDTIGKTPLLSAQGYMLQQRAADGQKIIGSTNPDNLPELRGELVSGRIIPKDPNLKLEEEVVALSLPGEQFVLKLTRTNGNGEFYFNLNQEYQNNGAFVQILGENKDAFAIELDEQSSINYADLKFDQLVITPQMTDLILKRSVHNQVENAFIEMKRDTVQPIQQILPVYRNFSKVYDLDDYTRFSTIRETASEVLEHVWIHRGNKDGEQLKIRGAEDEIDPNSIPLVLMDGLLIQRHSDIIDFDAKRIKKVNLSREDCVINSIVYKGIIAMETIDGNFHQEFSRDFILETELFSPLPSKRYFNQQYTARNTSKSAQIPDFREQLLWLPEVTLEEETTKIEFYTSDVAGTYEVYLEGFTEQGDPVSWKETFVVK